MTPPQPHPAHPFQSSFEALADSAPDAILTIDAESTILSANAAVERIFGYNPIELIGKRLSILIPERLRAAHDRGITRYTKSGRRNIPWTGVELPGLRKDGTEIPVEISFGEFTNELGERVFSGFVRDVSERVRQQRDIMKARAEAERALRELARVSRIIDIPLGRERYDTMANDLLERLRIEVEADGAAILLLDEDGTHLTIRASSGVNLEKVGRRYAVGMGVSGRIAAEGKAMIVGEPDAIAAFNEKLAEDFSSIAGVPLISDGRVIGVIIVGSPKTGQFDESDVRLLQLVAERTNGVFARTRLFAEVQAAVRARDEVLSIVSHDLRNPVATVAMSASLLSDPDITLTPEQQREQLGVIVRSADRMNRLIQDLLDVARIEGGRLKVGCKCEDATALAREVFEAFQPIALRRECELVFEQSPDLGFVFADRDRVSQLLGNYLNNALKFTTKGGRIVLRARPSTTTKGVEYSVTDNGPGMSPEELQHVFARFWQAKRTEHLGSGLGLAIAHGIAEAHKGRVWVESTPGVETTFFFELPPAPQCADGEPVRGTDSKTADPS